jgi:NhaP-type Na+/H+ or K+/H+ antiporter
MYADDVMTVLPRHNGIVNYRPSVPCHLFFDTLVLYFTPTFIRTPTIPDRHAVALLILSIGILVFLAHLFTALFQRTKVPDVLLLMILGIISGPILGLIGPQDFGTFGIVLTTIALTVILFEGGTNLEIPTIVRSAKETLALTLVTFSATVAIASVIAINLYHMPLLVGVALGTIIGGTSSAVVVPMVRGLKLKEPSGTVLVLESSLTDVLCIVLTYGVLEAMVSPHATVGKVAGGILASFFFASVIGVIGGHVWLFVLDRVRQFPDSIFTTFAFIFVLYGCAELLGFSGAITALSFGITLTNFRFFHFNRLPMLKDVEWSRLNETERRFYGEIVFLVKVFFFVYLGLSMRIEGIESFLLPLLIVTAVFAARLLITKLVVSPKVPWFERSVISIMVPKGLAAAVLAGLPAQYGIVEAGILQDVVYRTILISIVLTAVLVPLIDRVPLYRRFFGTAESSPPAAAP